MLQLLIKNGTCVSPAGIFQGDIGVSDGIITTIGQRLDVPAERTIDACSKLVLPGLIDAHVHMPWPSANLDSVDDFLSGTAAAVCGGVTTVIEYVVPDESGRIIPALDARLGATRGNSHSDYSFHLILRKVTAETFRDMVRAVERGFPSFKIFTAYEGYRLSDGETLQAMAQAKELRALVCFHAEDGPLISFATDQLARAGKTEICYYPEARPFVADLSGTSRVIAYARHIGGRVHIAHVNTAAGARMIRQAREGGLEISAETCPHYLMFTEDVYRNGKPEAHYYVLAPAIRTGADREGLWAALALGELHSIASDHCPYTAEQKLRGRGDFRRVPGGASGVETSLPLVYTYGVRKGRFPVERLVELMSTSPARIFDLYPRKGAITVGSDADLVIYDEDGRSTIDSSRLHSHTDHSLYEGIEVLGKPVLTILRGAVVAQSGELVAPRPTGHLLRRDAH